MSILAQFVTAIFGLQSFCEYVSAHGDNDKCSCLGNRQEGNRKAREIAQEIAKKLANTNGGKFEVAFRATPDNMAADGGRAKFAVTGKLQKLDESVSCHSESTCDVELNEWLLAEPLLKGSIEKVKGTEPTFEKAATEKCFGTNAVLPLSFSAAIPAITLWVRVENPQQDKASPMKLHKVLIAGGEFKAGSGTQCEKLTLPALVGYHNAVANALKQALGFVASEGLEWKY